MQTCRRSAFGCFPASTTRQIVNAANSSAGLVNDSSSRPESVSASAISSALASVSKWSLSQDKVNFISATRSCKSDRLNTAPVAKEKSPANFGARSQGHRFQYSCFPFPPNGTTFLAKQLPGAVTEPPKKMLDRGGGRLTSARRINAKIYEDGAPMETQTSGIFQSNISLLVGRLRGVQGLPSSCWSSPFFLCAAQ